ncbi:anthranilate phosphoribosyltransferase [Sandaracinobacter neustonicus]|uniref:Anthranilate phosphoribosyltransferase n=1 Tax=Sandaracinobacter neustonicus TaxID=1715348 RepID=A0A501XG37_9SPHN|nr:anthranilate phosphoribosyltransferase [Sandaracinobacter neustonicus]TPE59506.1 anthranilate phosphoribosyltransferase [Sandaracinobacter neustonicus]
MTSLPDPSRPLDPETAADAFDRILGADLSDSDIAAFLVALAERGETPDEIAAAATAMRARMLAVEAPDTAIDVCGTGGDGSHSLNVSTAVTFVVAACGVPVAKHGNRGASSRSGTADVLEALGWRPDLPMSRAEASLSDTGVAFLFAQAHHPALARVAPIRRALGRRTIFNLLGPLANPAGVRRQMIGVFAESWAQPMAEAALALGASDVLVVHGGGLDEIAVHADSALVRGSAGGIATEAFAPEAHGLSRHPRDAIAGGEPAENAAELRALFAGKGRPAYRDIVLANAAAALTVAGRSWPQAMADASDALDSGAAADRLALFLAFR